MNVAIELAERRMLPDRLLRVGIRNLLRRRRADESARAVDPTASAAWLAQMAVSPIALATETANQQHYAVPSSFFEAVLGPQLKYSSCLFPLGVEDLARAEEAMLSLTAERARLADGQRVLELGCGWGSLTLWMARHFPRSSITGVSNSRSQREYILDQARARGLDNVSIVTADVNHFQAEGQYDRIVSVEMFEHVRNWQALLERVHGWLAPDGRLFLHFFAHRRFSYPFEAVAADDWVGKHFFSGGMMPSVGLLRQLHIPLTIVEQWEVGGEHYARTAEAWLENLDRNVTAVTELFARDLGSQAAARHVQRWRMFFLACAELFGFDGGREWLVTHALLAPRTEGGAT
jgi:cyclopropane-fatty-acyl-phospholipid synthase